MAGATSVAAVGSLLACSRDGRGSMKIFEDRQEAGSRLAELLLRFEWEHPIVLALPRGGVPVAYEVARALGAPLDVLIVRKLGAPFQPELGVGALTEGGTRFVDEEMCAALGITP